MSDVKLSETKRAIKIPLSKLGHGEVRVALSIDGGGMGITKGAGLGFYYVAMAIATREYSSSSDEADWAFYTLKDPGFTGLFSATIRRIAFNLPTHYVDTKRKNNIFPYIHTLHNATVEIKLNKNGYLWGDKVKGVVAFTLQGHTTPIYTWEILTSYEGGLAKPIRLLGDDIHVKNKITLLSNENEIGRNMPYRTIRDQAEDLLAG